MEKSQKSWYKIIQALSLDVVTGAITFSLAISRYYGVQTPWSIMISLSIATWIIYTFDHLLDANKIKGKASTYRHQFHQKYKRALIVAIFILLNIGVIIMCKMPLSLIEIGLIGVLVCFVYFLLLQKTSFWAKEIYVAVMYTFGLFAGPVFLSYQHIQIVQWLLIPQIFLLAFSNLLIFSWYDFLKDQRDKQPSMVIHWGMHKANERIQFILAIGVIYCFVIIFLNVDESTFAFQIVILLMYSVLIMLFKKNDLFRKNDLYRIFGDGVFYIPLLFIMYAKH